MGKVQNRIDTRMWRRVRRRLGRAQATKYRLMLLGRTRGNVVAALEVLLNN